MTQSNDLPSRMNRAEDNIIDLRLAVSATLQAIDKNSADIADLLEVSRRNSELGRRNSELGRRNSEEISALLELTRRSSEEVAELRASQTRTDIAIQGIQASIERMDRLFDYLIHRDRGQSEE